MTNKINPIVESEVLENDELISYLDYILIERLELLLNDCDRSVETKVRLVKYEVQVNNQLVESLQ